MREHLRRLGALLAGWSLLAFVLAINRSIYKITIGQPAMFGKTLWEILEDYWIWAFLTPAVFWLARRFQFTRRDWPRSVVVHFCGYLVLTLLHEIAAVALHLPTWVPPTYQGSFLKLRIAASLNEDFWMYWPIVVTWRLFEYYQRYRERDLRAARIARAQEPTPPALLVQHVEFHRGVYPCKCGSRRRYARRSRRPSTRLSGG